MRDKYFLIAGYLLTGWRRPITIILLGVISATALPPWYFLPGIFSFSILATLLYKCANSMEIACVAWLFSFGYHLLGLHWLSNAFLIESDKFAFLIPIIFLGLPAVLALFPACLLSLFPLISSSIPKNMIAIASLWSLSDYIRGHLFTGFPWNLTSYAMSVSESLSQVASVFGAYGLNFLVIFVAVGPSVLLVKRCFWTRHSINILILCFLIPFILWFSGMVRLLEANVTTNPNVLIRIVQANISQKDKWRTELKFKNISKYLKLSNLPIRINYSDPSEQKIDFIIWPETAVPAFLANDRKLRASIMRALPASSRLITGAPAIAAQPKTQLHNSLFVISSEAKIEAQYDKVRLVPFGEYVPLKEWLPISKVVQGLADFRAGSGLKVLNVPLLGFISPVICYEIIFPGDVIKEQEKNQSNLIINLTNDAWFGNGAGPRQHLAIAKMRAIEEGVPLIRSANTGISGFYDAYGRTMGEINLNQEGILDQYLTNPIPYRTIYSRFGDSIYLSLIFSCLIFIFLKRNNNY
jgi:apolipoprotein N-acyltransferase